MPALKSSMSAFQITADLAVGLNSRRDMGLEWAQMNNWALMRAHTRKAVNSFPGKSFLEGTVSIQRSTLKCRRLGCSGNFGALQSMKFSEVVVDVIF